MLGDIHYHGHFIVKEVCSECNLSGDEGDTASLHSLHNFINHAFISDLKKRTVISLTFKRCQCAPRRESKRFCDCLYFPTVSCNKYLKHDGTPVRTWAPWQPVANEGDTTELFTWKQQLRLLGGKSLMVLGNTVFIQTSLLRADLKLWPLTTRHHFRSSSSSWRRISNCRDHNWGHLYLDVVCILALLSSCWWWWSRCGHTYLTPILPVETQSRVKSYISHLQRIFSTSSKCSGLQLYCRSGCRNSGNKSPKRHRCSHLWIQFSFTKLRWS